MSVDVFACESPVDGRTLPEIAATDAATVEARVTAARLAAEAWADLSVERRVDALAQLKPRLLRRAREIAELVHAEVGKPLEEAALAEVLPNADLVDYWCDTIEELLEPALIEPDPLAYPGKRGQVVRAPRGVVALVTPWNFPVAIPLRTLVPALLAGNAVVWKPSEIAPRSGALVASLFEGLVPEGVLSLVQGGADVGRALVASSVDSVVFTGSVSTGRAISAACAERFIPCSLELGGKDAAIVLEDCDLERTANGLVWGAFNNAGQNCASIERVFVVSKVAEALLAKIVDATRALGPSDIGRMTTKAQCDKARLHLDAAVASGAEVLVGGAPESVGHEFLPTVIRIDGDSARSEAMTEETFGPLLPIEVVAGEDEAVARANDSRFALTSSVWTKDTRRGERIARRLRTGVVTVNNHGFTAALPATPWTGSGESGTGVTNGPHCLSALTRPRLILVDSNRAARELWWYPYTPALRAVAFGMAVVRGGSILQRLRAIPSLLRALLTRLMGDK